MLLIFHLLKNLVLLGDSAVKNLPAGAGAVGLIPGLGRSPEGENGNPVFLPGQSHRLRSLAGYGPWGRKRVGYNLASIQS